MGAPEACTGTAGPSAAANLTTSYVYDARGNVIKQASPDPSATSGGSSATITTASAFEADNRLCRVVENATAGTDLQALAHPCSDATQDAGTLTTNLSTRYGYDGIGNLTSMVDAAGNTTTYGYDAAGHPTGRTDAQSGALAWTYDDIGNRTAQRNRIDPVLTTSVAWTYDPFGRMLSRTADSATTSGTYDMSGNKLTATSAIGTITATYDRLNRVLTVDDEDAGSTADTTYTYALSSSSWSDPSGSYTASLDAYNRATSLTDPADGATPFSWSYGSGGQVLSATAPNGNITTRTYDGVSRELDRETKTGSTSRAHYTWAYNGAGQVLSEASTVAGDPANGTLTYAYDPLGQLTGSTLSGTATAYGWDKATNRTSVQMGAGTAATTAYDAANRPTSGANPTSSYASDADGELIARPGQTFVWDHLGRLTAVKDAAGTTTLAAYTYDPLDRLRTAADGAGGRVRFRYTGLTTAVAQWWDDVAGTVSRNVGNGWTGERLLDWLPGATPDRRYYGENAHHDVTWLADNSGAVSKQLRYDSWGNPRSAVPSGYTPFRFQGSWYDPNSDLSWVVTRWYAPSLGRFVSEDTLLGNPARPDSRNLYAYAVGDPVGHWDPFGLDDWWRECDASVQDLRCSVTDFDQMSAYRRLAWLRSFETRYKINWFKAIEGVLLGSADTGAIRAGSNWFSLVDAYILAAVQDGMRMREGKSALVSGDPASALWRSFFTYWFRRVDDSNNPGVAATLRYLWGRAEQTATDYGTILAIARGRWPTLQAWMTKGVTDIWRWTITNGDRIASLLDGPWCYLVGTCWVTAPYWFARDLFLDPRSDPQHIRLIMDGIWTIEGWVACQRVDVPQLQTTIRLC